MMFVSGETGDVSAETTTMIEGIVQQQVVEMVRHKTISALYLNISNILASSNVQPN